MEWRRRLKHEAAYHTEGCFVTLTVNEHNLQMVSQSVVSVMQNFIKRFRERISPTKIKYFWVAEHGEKTDRLHYHVLIFGYYPKWKHRSVIKRSKYGLLYTDPTFEEIWGHGQISYGALCATTIDYVCKYLLKNLERTDRKPVKRCSNGIGKEFALAAGEHLVRGYLAERGKKTPIPRYYKKLLGLESGGNLRAILARLRKIKKGKNLNPEQREKNLLAQLKLSKDSL